jgi:hypothetical protein
LVGWRDYEEEELEGAATMEMGADVGRKKE